MQPPALRPKSQSSGGPRNAEIRGTFTSVNIMSPEVVTGKSKGSHLHARQFEAICNGQVLVVQMSTQTLVRIRTLFCR